MKHFYFNFKTTVLVLIPLLFSSCIPEKKVGFQNQAEKIGIETHPGYGRGVTVVDFDNDGHVDIYDTDSNMRVHQKKFPNSQFFKNNGKGKFEKMNWGISDADTYLAWGASAADFDRDGDIDLLLLNGGYRGKSTISLYLNRLNETGTIKFEKKIGSGLSNEKKRWWGASWGDYNNDGWVDLVILSRKGKALLYRNHLGKRLIEEAELQGINLKFEDGKNPIWLDYNNDGWMDLYLAGMKNHALYKNDQGKFTKINTNWFKGTPNVFSSLAADFNQDGQIDLYLGRFQNQDKIVFFDKKGNSSIHGLDIGINASVGKHSIENTMGLGSGDIDHNGYPDILIGTGGPTWSGYDLVFCNFKNKKFPYIRLKPCGGFAKSGHGKNQTHGIVVTDFNSDGQNDIFFNIGGSSTYDLKYRTDSSGKDAIYFRGGKATYNYAWIKLKGNLSNKDGIGAKLKIITKDATQYKNVLNAQGFQSQNSFWKLLILGKSTEAKLYVQWPSGNKSVHIIKAKQRQTIKESDTLN